MKKNQSRYGALKTAFAVTVIIFLTVLWTGFSFAQGTNPGDGRGDSGAQVQVTNTSDHPIPVYFATKTKSSGSKAPTKTVVVKDTVTVVNNYYSQPDPNGPLMAPIVEINYVNGNPTINGVVRMHDIPIGRIGDVSKNQPENSSWMDEVKRQNAGSTWWSDNWPWVVCAILFLLALNWIWNQREQQAAERERLRRIHDDQRRSEKNLNDMFSRNANINQNVREQRFAQNAPPPPAQNQQGNVYQVPVNLEFEVWQRGVSPHNCPPRQ